jgi:5-methylcytosine-specific restriction endonuclease McrA
MSTPLDYPSEAQVRRHGPAGYREYQSFKPWLRDEFTFRCVFCLLRERWCPLGADSFGVEHLNPRSLGPEWDLVYDNLLYACMRCNSVKADQTGILDPCAEGFGRHLRVKPNGTVEGLTEAGVA